MPHLMDRSILQYTVCRKFGLAGPSHGQQVWWLCHTCCWHLMIHNWWYPVNRVPFSGHTDSTGHWVRPVQWVRKYIQVGRCSTPHSALSHAKQWMCVSFVLTMAKIYMCWWLQCTLPEQTTLRADSKLATCISCSRHSETKQSPRKHKQTESSKECRLFCARQDSLSTWKKAHIRCQSVLQVQLAHTHKEDLRMQFIQHSLR